ncbi:MAG: hypothetical protein EB078_01345 [Proteobacteria bacterium]|nr:hypothetical protein [Pseudomonadota bacterium]NDD03524.1 hypothetical protein [Pseudomonadota bacterium]
MKLPKVNFYFASVLLFSVLVTYAKQPKPLEQKTIPQGQPCLQGKCAEGLKCLTYYGIAGPSGPAFSSCEIPCQEPDSSCPSGQRCTTIADGPGPVCRPINQH